MRAIWLNDGEADDNGEYIAIIENEAGEQRSKFKGKSYKEVADKLLESQAKASHQLARFLKPDKATKQPLKVETKPFTPDDKFRLATEITDPNKVVEAVTEIITSQQGVSPDKIGKEYARLSQEEQDRILLHEANEFRKEHPEYYPDDANFNALIHYMKGNKWDFTRNNLAIAFETLSERNELTTWPDGDQEPPQPNGNTAPQPNGNTAAAPPQPAATAPTPRPRTIATGIRNSDASALPPQPKKKVQYTRADIERMSRVEYTQRLQSDPDFRKQVDAMGA